MSYENIETSLKRIFYIREEIYNEYFPDTETMGEDRVDIAKKLINAVQTISANAQSTAVGLKPIIMTENGGLTFEESENLIVEIYQILQINDFMKYRYEKVIETIKKFNVNPDILLSYNW